MNKTQLKAKQFMSMILVILCFCMVSVVIFKNIIDKAKYNRTTTLESIKEEQFNTIWTSLKRLKLSAEIDASETAENIKKDILKLPEEDFLQLQSDMNDELFNLQLHEILDKNINGKNLNGIENRMNSIVVMTTNGVLEDYNYKRTTKEDQNHIIRNWEYMINNSYNKELESDAIDKLLNKSNDIIALESYNLIKNKDHIKIDEMTYDKLLEVYTAEGIEGLKNYQILVPSYITEYGDIFGNPDIIYGTRKENNKLIIIQEFNLYDQLMSTQSELFTDGLSKAIILKYDELLRLLNILGLALVASIFSLIVYLCSIYNQMITNEEDKK